MALLRDIGRFALMVVHQWALTVGSVIVAVLGLLNEHFGWLQLGGGKFWYIVFALLVVACFLAWREEHHKVMAAQDGIPEARRKAFISGLKKLSPDHQAVLREVAIRYDAPPELLLGFLKDAGHEYPNAEHVQRLVEEIQDTTGLAYLWGSPGGWRCAVGASFQELVGQWINDPTPFEK